jgi:hypothetical protein
MSYGQATNAFADLTRATENMTDVRLKALFWNLSAGLGALTAALENDMQGIKSRLDRLEKNTKCQG